MLVGFPLGFMSRRNNPGFFHKAPQAAFGLSAAMSANNIGRTIHKRRIILSPHGQSSCTTVVSSELVSTRFRFQNSGCVSCARLKIASNSAGVLSPVSTAPATATHRS